MPIYEYQCESCDNQFDLLLSINNRDNPTKELCLKCDEKSIKRRISIPLTGADATLTLDKMCPGFKKKMESISKSPVVNRAAKKNLDRAASFSPSGHLRPN